MLCVTEKREIKFTMVPGEKTRGEKLGSSRFDQIPVGGVALVIFTLGNRGISTFPKVPLGHGPYQSVNSHRQLIFLCFSGFLFDSQLLSRV